MINNVSSNHVLRSFSLEPIGEYKDETIVLELPGVMTVFDIDFLAVWDDENKENLGSVIIPDELNVPPALTSIIVSALGF